MSPSSPSPRRAATLSNTSSQLLNGKPCPGVNLPSLSLPLPPGGGVYSRLPTAGSQNYPVITIVFEAGGTDTELINFSQIYIASARRTISTPQTTSQPPTLPCRTTPSRHMSCRETGPPSRGSSPTAPAPAPRSPSTSARASTPSMLGSGASA